MLILSSPFLPLVNVEDCDQFGVPLDQILSTIYNRGKRLNSTAVSLRNLWSGLRKILNFWIFFFMILSYSYVFCDVVVLLVHHISTLQVGAHLRIPLTLSIVCCKRLLKGTVGVNRGKRQKIQQLISIYLFIKMFSLLNKNQLRIWIWTRHQQHL